jgi:hypothetical protein
LPAAQLFLFFINIPSLQELFFTKKKYVKICKGTEELGGSTHNHCGFLTPHCIAINLKNQESSMDSCENTC